MKFSEGGQDKLLPALIAARAEFEPVFKAREAVVQTDKGSYTYTYAGFGETLNLVTPILLKNGLMMSFDPDILAGTPTPTGDEVGRKVRITVLIEHDSGQWRSISLDFPYAKTGPGMNIYQAIGAIVTYGSRILMNAILGLASVDNDAVEAEEREQAGKKGGNGHAHEKPAQAATAGAQQAPAAAQAPTHPRSGERTLVAPECIDAYEAAKQMLDEKVVVGDKEVALFMPDQVTTLTKKLGTAARDLSAMTLLYAEIENAAAASRARLEGRKA